MNQCQPYKKLVTKLTTLSKKSNWIMMRVLDLQMNYPETSYENIHQLQKLLVHTFLVQDMKNELSSKIVLQGLKLRPISYEVGYSACEFCV